MLEDAEIEVKTLLGEETYSIKELQKYLRKALQLDMILGLSQGIISGLLAQKKIKDSDVKELMDSLNWLISMPPHEHKLDELSLEGHNFLTKEEFQTIHFLSSDEVSKSIEAAVKPINSALKMLSSKDYTSEIKGRIDDIGQKLRNSASLADLDSLKREIELIRDDSLKLLKNLPKQEKVDFDKIEKSILAKVEDKLNVTVKYESGDGKYYRIQKNFAVGRNGLVPAPTQAEATAQKVLAADGTWITGGGSTVTTDSTLTGDGTAGTPLGINLTNSNTFSVTQTINDGTGNVAILGNTAGNTGGSFTGVGVGLTVSTSSNSYSANIASNSDFAAGYFSDNTNFTSVYLASASYAVDAAGAINTTSDYYINGAAIPVSYWSNDAGYITAAGAVTSITGTANQVIASASTGAVTLSLPQSIATTSTPQFQRMGLGVAAAATTNLKMTLAGTTHRGLEINGIASQTGDYLTILNNSGTKQFWFASTGAMGFGSGALAGMANANLGPYLDVSFGGSPGTIVMGAENNNVTRTNLTNKVGRFIGAPYNTSHVGTALLIYDSTASANALYWGGGSSVGQAATQQLFYTASAINTPTGTQRLALFGSGRIAAGDGLVEAYTARLAVVHTATTTDSTLELRGMAAQTGSLLMLRNSAGTALSAFDANGYLSVGEGSLNTASPRAYAQSVTYTTTSISDNSATLKSLTNITNTSAMSTYAWAGMWSRIYKSGTGTTEAVYGIGGQIETAAGAGTLAQCRALYYVQQYASNVTTSYGIDLYSSVTSPATVGTRYGIYLKNMVGTGTLTTQYGIYLEDMTKGGTNFAIRSLGGEVAFAGQTNVGLTGGAGKLSVLSTTEQLRLYYDVSNYLATTVSSAGAVTFNAVGASASFTFSDPINLNGVATGLPAYYPVAVSDETTALTTGTAKVTFRIPRAMTVTAVRASVTTAPTGASLLTIDINENGTSILSTKLTIDASEKTSTTAATPAVISDGSLADDSEITIDIDQVGSTIAGAGLKVVLIGTWA